MPSGVISSIMIFRFFVYGNDEITDMAEYFNETIAKIDLSIKAVGESSDTMENVGSTLASNMTETASAVHEISSNILNPLWSTERML